jgi:hypothetical protein
LTNKGEEHIPFPEKLGSQHNILITKVSWKRMMLWKTISSAQNYLIFGLFPLSDILENRKHDIPETGSVSILM